MLYEIEKECLSALCQMRNKLPELFLIQPFQKMDLLFHEKVDLGHQSIVLVLIIEISFSNYDMIIILC